MGTHATDLAGVTRHTAADEEEGGTAAVAFEGVEATATARSTGVIHIIAPP